MLLSKRYPDDIHGADGASVSCDAMKLLTQERVRAYCFIILGINLLMLSLTFVRGSKGLTVFGAPVGGDFVAFYVAGRIVNEYGSDRLYDMKLQDTLIHATVPEVPANLTNTYVNPPFFALLFAPLAWLPFIWAYVIWLFFSLLLYVGAVLLALHLNPVLPRGLTVLTALAFPPFCMYVLGGGQVSAFGCFCLALAMHRASTGHRFDSGLVLALLLYKPPLVVLIVPALFWARRFRILGGFAVGAVLLTVLCWLLVGTAGLINYARLLQAFGSMIGFGDVRAAKYVDLGAFIRQLFHVSVNLRPALLLLALPLTYFLRRDPWGATIPLTLVLNSYATVYDMVLVVPILITTDTTRLGPWAIVAVFLGSLIGVPIAMITGVQLLTPLLAWLAWRLYRLSRAARILPT